MIHYSIATSKKEALKNPDAIYLYETSINTPEKVIKEIPPNAYGIPLKHGFGAMEKDYFTDQNIDFNKRIIKESFNKIPRGAPLYILPLQGLGSGVSKLEEKAPLTYKYLIDLLSVFVLENTRKELV